MKATTKKVVEGCFGDIHIEPESRASNILYERKMESRTDRYEVRSSEDVVGMTVFWPSEFAV